MYPKGNDETNASYASLYLNILLKKAEFVIAEASFSIIDSNNSKFLERTYTKAFLEKFSRWGYPQFVLTRYNMLKKCLMTILYLYDLSTRSISGKNREYQRNDDRLVLKSDVNFPLIHRSGSSIPNNFRSPSISSTLPSRPM
jgi:hypothetical protein